MQAEREVEAIRVADPSDGSSIGRATGIALWLRLALALAALIVSLIGSDPRIGVTVDSGEYIAVADGLMTGERYSMPYLSYDEPYPVEADALDDRVDITAYPPVYSTLVAAVDWVLPFGWTVAVRWISAVAFGVTAYALASMCRKPATAVLATLGLLSFDLVTVHSMAWSEPVLLASTAVAMLFATRYLKSRSVSDLGFMCLAAATASGARFIGTAVGVGIALGLALCLPRARRAAVVVAAAGALPTVLWFVRNTFILGAPSEKVISWHPPGAADFQDAVATVEGWTINAGTWCLLLLLPAIAVLVLTRSEGRSDQATARLRIGLAGAAMYVGFLLAARALVDANIPMDGRLLAPVHLFLLVALVAAAEGVPSNSTLGRRIAVGLVGIGVLAGAVVGVERAANISGIEASGYSARRWIDSDGIAYVDSLSDKRTDTPVVTVVTNAPDAVWLLTGHESLRFVPLQRSLYTGKPNEDYETQVAALKESIPDWSQSVIVFFDRPTRGGTHALPRRLEEGLDLVLLQDLDDATVYGIRQE